MSLNKIHIILWVLGIITLGLSYLFFLNIFNISIFEICGSPCEYWWSWLINFPTLGPCIVVCQPRNSLYKPFFIIGIILIILGVISELINWKKNN